MKKIFLVLLCLVLVGCGKEPNNPSENPQEQPKTESESFKESYEELNKEGVTITIDENLKVDTLTISELNEFLKNGTGILYLSTPSDYASRLVLPILSSKLIENNQTLYYYDLSGEISNPEQYSNIQAKLEPHLTKEGEDVIMILPEVFALKNGEILGHYSNDFRYLADGTIVISDADKALFNQNYQMLIDLVK